MEQNTRDPQAEVKFAKYYKKDKDGNYVKDEKGNLIVEKDREVIYEANCMTAERCSYLCAKCGEPLVPKGEFNINNTYSPEYQLYTNYQHPATNPNHLLTEKIVDGVKKQLMIVDTSKESWEATCTKEGRGKTYICLDEECPYMKEGITIGGETLDKKPHTYNEDVSRSYRAADCRQAGHEASKSCTTCKTTYYWDKNGDLIEGKTNTYNPDKAPVDLTFTQTSHKDVDGDGYCDLKYITTSGKEEICGLNVNVKESDGCSCICHKEGIMFIIALILKWFWKLTSSNQYCAAPCGKAHY